MVTEIRQALRDTADATPLGTFDLADVVAAGERRVRHRRIGAAVGSAALTLAVVLGATTLTTGEDRAEFPLPADLSLDDAEAITLDVVARRTAPWEVPDDAEGLATFTVDGRLVQGRGTVNKETFQLGLLDPTTGGTDWLPRPSWQLGELAPVELGADRLMYFDWQGPRRLAILSFDRLSRTWRRSAVEVPRGEVDRLFGAIAPQLGDDNRLYLLDPDDGQHWWSVPTTGGPITPEPSLEGTWATWSGSLSAAGDTAGHITISRGGRPVAEVSGPPQTCSAPRTSLRTPPNVQFAGSRLVARFTCGEGNQVVVYDEAGGRELTIAVTQDLWVEAADEEHLVLTDLQRIYLLHLDSHELFAIDTTNPKETADADLGAGLVAWDTVVWNSDRGAWDTVHKVAHLP